VQRAVGCVQVPGAAAQVAPAGAGLLWVWGVVLAVRVLPAVCPRLLLQIRGCARVQMAGVRGVRGCLRAWPATR
jgi:hypothetical protein